ncbi:phospholipase membrane-associated-like [Lichtheimia corymbifera JMRC:FSU:9682]|uniref:Phospholipase membrane-associated-like n=1 Tax=Lichtheimia corymbifera JMRC:FSU:9682 TaxID=1263082 RepID=A0A068RW42_9FUNG|nr:phospholipase membrane-associated-like [Lichtheimia corymbifera JMRC:FSU:9682]
MKAINVILLLGCAIAWCSADDSLEDALGDDTSFAREAKTIEECPTLPEYERATSVHKLRPKDIEVVAAIGDSLSSAVAAINIDTQYLTPEQFKQYRGLSFDMGGDEDAITIPNFLEHYTREPLIGPSIGVRDVPISEETFFAYDASQVSEIDRLNAAIPAATSYNFTQQAEYLIERIGKNTAMATKWKLITVFMGLNDLSASCLPGYSFLEYRQRMEEGIELLKQNIDYAIISVVGLLHSEQMQDVTKKDPTYRKHFKDEKMDVQTFECICCHHPISGTKLLPQPLAGLLDMAVAPLGKQQIARNVELYDRELRRLVMKQANRGADATTTVVYQPFNIDINSVPVRAISNLDGFHPNKIGQEYMAKAYWNQLFLPSNKKEQNLRFSEDLPLYCPTGNDYIQTM